jgi:hypothetical protein
MLHPDEETLDRFQAEVLSSAERVGVRNHLLWCRNCGGLILGRKSEGQSAPLARPGDDVSPLPALDRSWPREQD